MYMRRVVITGMGVVTSIGKDVETFWQSLTNGKHGFSQIGGFDCSDMEVKIAADGKDFGTLTVMYQKELRRTARYCQFAIDMEE